MIIYRPIENISRSSGNKAKKNDINTTTGDLRPLLILKDVKDLKNLKYIHEKDMSV